MASVERPSYTQAIPDHARRVTEGGVAYALWTDRTGQAVKARVLDSGKCRRTVARKWVGVYRDEHGKRRKTKPFGDRSVALEAALKLERHARAVRDGSASPHRPADGRAHLIDHVADYVTHLEAEGDSADHAQRVGASLRTLIARHSLTTPAAVRCEALAAALEWDRKAGDPRGRKRTGPLSVRTRNKRVGELRAFGRWLARTGRAQANPFDGLVMGNAELDRRRVRRALPVAEFGRLLATVRASADTVLTLPAADRWALYLLAAYTGLRAGALARLTPEAFTLDTSGVPTAVYSSARLQKGKSAHGVPLAPAVGDALADWLRGRPPGVPLWGRRPRWADRAAELLRHDLAAAGIPFRDATGQVFDFHSLRGQFAFLLATSGVPLVAAQQLLDHSTPTLTANVYSRFGGELAAEVAKLPSLGSALGTEGGGTSGKDPPEVKKRTGGGGGKAGRKP